MNNVLPRTRNGIAPFAPSREPMLIKIGYELVFNVPATAPMTLALFLRPEIAHVLRQPEFLQTHPVLPVDTFIDPFGNRIGRILAPPGTLTLYYDNVAIDSGEPEPSIEGTVLHRVEELPPECLQFLLASRYCEVDRMTDFAWNLFGHTPPTWERVKAIVDWAHNQITFGYQHARATRTAYEACEERLGVCRDYMHLAVTLLRCMNVPARYATGYLGDIGVPYNPAPMDFSAYLEVYLSGHWWAMDARHNKRRIGRLKQAHGRDAADVALTTSFGPTSLTSFKVWTEELK
jgi:transglutaminase-like putative cysteine protease